MRASFVNSSGDAGQHAVQRAGQPGELERSGEHVAVVDLPPRAGAHEAAQLLLTGPVSLGWLPGEGAERAELALRLDQLLDPANAERADQLVFQVRHADEEPEPGQAGPVQPGAEPGLLQAAPEIALLPLVAQARQPDPEPPRAEQAEEVPDVGRAAHRHDEDALVA